MTGEDTPPRGVPVAASERLSDEELAMLREIAATHSGGIKITQARALLLLDELRDRRAADLTDFERLVLECHRDQVARYPLTDRTALEVLGKLLRNAALAAERAAESESKRG